MKRRIKFCFLFVLTMSTAFCQEITGRQIIEHVDALMNQNSSHAQSTMTIITSSGKERTFVYESWSKNRGEKNLIRYTSPKRVKGQATLMLNHSDDIYMYFPRTNRVRKLASHAKKQKMDGSDFSYEDMGSGNSFLVEYASTRLKDQKIDKTNCYQIELTKKPNSNAGYSKLIIFSRQSDFSPLLIQYYDDKDANRLEKELTLKDIQMIQEIPTACFMRMHNKNDNTHTTMTIKAIEYNIELPDDLFTERGLKK